eukprot:3670315-Heterocapsa_arctica.AAC.1
MGGATALQGRTIGFLGEFIGDQLPTVVVMPDAAGQTMVDCVELDNCDVPTALEVDAALSGNGPPI